MQIRESYAYRCKVICDNSLGCVTLIIFAAFGSTAPLRLVVGEFCHEERY